MEYGCIGEKLGHSFSQIIHNELCDYKYELREIPKNELDDFMKKADFKAINVTIPYKQDVIPYLHYVSDTAKKIGAVNIVVNKNGKLYGYNTDFSGMTALIKKNNIDLNGKKVLILGSGGTSKTAFCVAESLGAKEIFRVSRNGSDSTITYNSAETLHNDTQIIINTTPCGMYPNIGTTAIDINKFNCLEAVVDAVYNPLSSALVVKAREKGIKAVGGLYMLVAQAFFAAEKFTDKKLCESEIDRVYNMLLSSKKNIVLIGMPGCGKSTVGSRIAKQLGKTFVDTDVEIVKLAGIEIPEIFEKFGEEHFRRIEADVIKNISTLQNCVIATGGGAVLNRENVLFLKGNGTVIFIDRPIDKIFTTSDRPLSSNRELLKKRFDERYDIYKSSADYCIKSLGSIKESVNAVKEIYDNEVTCY